MKRRKEKTARRIAWWFGISGAAAEQWLRGAKDRALREWLATGRRPYRR